MELAKPSTPNPGLKYYYPVPKASNPVEGNYDVVVYGGTPGGVAAAIQAKRMGKTAALYVFRRHVGGLTSAGLTETDLGKKEAIGGMAVEFFEKVGKWRHFRPSEAEKTFLTMLAEADVPVFFEHRLHKAEKDGLKITKITFENGNSAKGKMFVDATYEGDLFAKAGISYMVGREDNSMFGEDYNGTYFSKTSHVYRHQFDPYVKPGDPSSGLLEGITDTKVDKLGVGDKKLQSYCFRTWAMKDGKHVPWPKPEEYRTERYEILKRYVNAAPSPDFWDLRYKHGPVKLNEGDFVTVIGGNGAGKSTMLNAVAGVWPVDEGKIIIDGVDVTRLSEHQRAAYIGRVFQDPMTGTAATMQIEENLALAARRGKPRTLRIGITKAEREQYRELLKTLDLGLENRLTARVGLLSGGQRQALTLLMATMNKPKLLLLDEHTAALDPKTALKVLTLSAKIVEENHLTTMMITHNMKDAIKYGNRLIMMHEGHIIYDVAGEEKKNLHVSDLLAKFQIASGGEFANDRMMLS